MLSNGFDAPLRLKLEPSRLLIRFQLLVHVLAFVAISLPSAIPISIKIILCGFVFTSTALMYYKHKKSDIEEFMWQKNTLWLESVDEKEKLWYCQRGSLVTPMFVLVRLLNENQKRLLLIVQDQCDEQSFRRLRVKLKYFQGEVAIPTDTS